MRHTKILFLILIFASGLYLYKLGSNPPGLYADEASTGYNTYSLIKTGRDEYGKFFPFGFRQLGSYTPPLYIYLSTPSVGMFGISPFSTRFLSVLCGLLTITIIFQLLQEFKISKSTESLAFTTLFLVITPWLVFFSRMGYEQNLAFFLFTLSIYLFAKSLKNKKFLLTTIPVISLATYADFPMRYLMPLLTVILAFVFRKRIKLKNKTKKFIIVGIIVAAIIQIPNLYLARTKSFYDKGSHFYSEAIQVQSEKLDHYFPHKLSVTLAFVREFSAQYFEYFSPRSLFFEGDPDPQRSIPELSVFYPWMIFLYFLGLYLLYNQKKSDHKKLLVILLFVTPLTGAFTKQPFHIQRTLAMLLPLTLIMGIAIDFTFQKLGNKRSSVVFSILFIGSIILFWRSYFVLLPQMRYSIWGSEWKTLAAYIKSHPNDHFIIDQQKFQGPEENAYYQLALYMQIDPKIVQKSADPKYLENYYNDVSFSPYRSFLNIEMKPIDWGETVWKNEILVGSTAAISDDEAILHNLTQIFEIKDPNDQIILRGFQTNPNR